MTPASEMLRVPGAGKCRGAVTAEFAVALPAVLLLLGMLLAGSAAGLTQLRLEEAARAGARA
jgi:Flp pilus assembly protein TadG